MWLFRRKLFAEEIGCHQSNRGNECKKPNANASDNTSRPKHKGCTSVANFQLVRQQVTFNDQENQR
jgi:hypothetical protein